MDEREKHIESLTHRFYQNYGHKWWKRGVEHKIPPVPGNNFDDNGGSVLVVSLSFASACLTIAKDCLLTGQEQACTRITWLFVCLFVCHPAENGTIYRKMVVDSPLVITSKVKPFSRPDKTRKEEWLVHLVQPIFCLTLGLSRFTHTFYLSFFYTDKIFGE